MTPQQSGPVRIIPEPFYADTIKSFINYIYIQMSWLTIYFEISVFYSNPAL